MTVVISHCPTCPAVAMSVWAETVTLSAKNACACAQTSPMSVPYGRVAINGSTKLGSFAIASFALSR